MRKNTRERWITATASDSVAPERHRVLVKYKVTSKFPLQIDWQPKLGITEVS